MTKKIQSTFQEKLLPALPKASRKIPPEKKKIQISPKISTFVSQKRKT
jgi:hypothetical protein